MVSVLFVCLGNICRSQCAETVFRQMTVDKGVDDRIVCDSAGTIGFHEGEKADSRMIKRAKLRGYDIVGTSRKITTADFDKFDIIIAMDDNNVSDICRFSRNENDMAKVETMVKYSQSYDIDLIPDPYYGNIGDFDLVIDLLEDACAGLLQACMEKL